MGLGPGGGVRRDGPQEPGARGRLELVDTLSVDLAASDARHGVGLFETIRIARGAARRLPRHLARLRASCAALYLPEPPPDTAVAAYAEERRAARALAEGVLRLVAVDTCLLVTVAPYVPPTGPVAIGVARAVARGPGSATARHKTLSYLDNALLAREARERGLFDVVAPCGAPGAQVDPGPDTPLADGGRSALIAVFGGVAVTPPLADGALPGIVRGLLLERGLVREARVTLADLGFAEAAAVANALVGVLPVERIDGVGPLSATHEALAPLVAAGQP